MNTMKFLARMVQYAATKWLGKSLQLYSTSGNLGILKAIFPEPADTLTEDEVASLKTVPGVYEAYQGLHKLSLDVLVFGLSLFFFVLPLIHCCLSWQDIPHCCLVFSFGNLSQNEAISGSTLSVNAVKVAEFQGAPSSFRAVSQTAAKGQTYIAARWVDGVE